jgi:hypothetical protein
MRNFLINLIAFQATWFAFVWGGANGHWWLGFVFLVPFAAWQLTVTRWRRSDLTLIAIAVVAGIIVESALVQTGQFRYATPVPWTDWAPVWMVGLWVNFALTINHTMTFLRGRTVLAVVLGAVAGPLAYYGAGQGFAALTLTGSAWVAFGAVGLAYAVVTPLMSALGARIASREDLARAGA